MTSLREIGRHVGRLVKSFDPLDPQAIPTLTQVLRAYADALVPWARATALNMLNEANRADQAGWQRLSNAISGSLRAQLLRTPVGDRIRELMEEQVALIRSIPIDAAHRVHELSIKAVEEGSRAQEIAEQIFASGEVAASHATLIARTETGRASTAFLQARSQHAGITHYIWRTARDRDVRPGHRVMEGKVCAWDDPPAVNENGRVYRIHPATIFNCRCFAEPVLPAEEPIPSFWKRGV